MTHDWSTPKAFFGSLNDKFHFTLDACATARNAKCRRYFTKRDDALKQRWTGRVFCNPPYDRQLHKWVEKGYREAKRGALVVMLLPASTDSNWYHRWCAGRSWIEFVKGRLTFSKKGRASFASMVVVFKRGQEPWMKGDHRA